MHDALSDARALFCAGSGFTDCTATVAAAILGDLVPDELMGRVYAQLGGATGLGVILGPLAGARTSFLILRCSAPCCCCAADDCACRSTVGVYDSCLCLHAVMSLASDPRIPFIGAATFMLFELFGAIWMVSDRCLPLSYLSLSANLPQSAAAAPACFLLLFPAVLSIVVLLAA